MPASWTFDTVQKGFRSCNAENLGSVSQRDAKLLAIKLWECTIHTWSTTFCTANHFFRQSSFFVEAWVSKTEIAIGWRFNFAIWPTVWLLSRNTLFWFFGWWCIWSWLFVGRSSRCTCKKWKIIEFQLCFHPNLIFCHYINLLYSCLWNDGFYQLISKSLIKDNLLT